MHIWITYSVYKIIDMCNVNTADLNVYVNTIWMIEEVKMIAREINFLNLDSF